MTLKEAHTWLENKQTMMTQNRWAFDSIDIEANGMAIIAIEKQIPKKPILLADGNSYGELVYDIAECPECGHELDFEGHEHHCICGQAIDWSEETDE